MVVEKKKTREGVKGFTWEKANKTFHIVCRERERERVSGRERVRESAS